MQHVNDLIVGVDVPGLTQETISFTGSNESKDVFVSPLKLCLSAKLSGNASSTNIYYIIPFMTEISLNTELAIGTNQFSLSDPFV